MSRQLFGEEQAGHQKTRQQKVGTEEHCGFRFAPVYLGRKGFSQELRGFVVQAR